MAFSSRIRKNTKEEILLKRFLYYFIWTIAIGFVLYVGMQLQLQVAERAQLTFNIFPLHLYIALFPVIIGLLVRTPKFILQLKERKSWTFDWILFAAVGLPALYLVIMTFLPFSPLGRWLPIHMFLYINGSTVTTIAGLVLGYMMLDSFKIKSMAKSEEVQ